MPDRTIIRSEALDAAPLPSAEPARAPRKDFLGVSRPDIGDDEIAELERTLRSGWLTSGPNVQRFQDDVASYVCAAHASVLNSCTAGMMLALRLLDVGPGDEVLLPAITFVACANVIEHAGARPVFVDSLPDTGLIDLAHAETLVSERTRALMPVHLAGRPVDLEAVAAFRDRHGVAVIEDGAHAIGAEWAGRRVGAWGNLCSFSFHATKNMTTFEGGALVTRTAEETERVQRLALHGLTRSAWTRHGSGQPGRYDVIEPGFKLGMTDVAAAVGMHQLRRLDGWIERREALSRHYDRRLALMPLDLAPPVPAGARHARHLYMTRVSEHAPLRRDALVESLRARNIGSSVHFHGIHEMTYYRERYGLRPEDLPVGTDWSARALTLPLHPGMSFDDVDDVVSALEDSFAAAPAV